MTFDMNFIFTNKSRLLDGVTHCDAIPNSQCFSDIFLCGDKIFNPSLWSGCEYRLLSRTARLYIMVSFNARTHVFSSGPG